MSLLVKIEGEEEEGVVQHARKCQMGDSPNSVGSLVRAESCVLSAYQPYSCPIMEDTVDGSSPKVSKNLLKRRRRKSSWMQPEADKMAGRNDICRSGAAQALTVLLHFSASGSIE